MRHQTKKHTLGKAQDQRKALLRSLATELFTHGEIKTTMARAKALQPYAENVITMAKKGDLNSRRLAGKYICLLYTSPSPRDPKTSRMPSSA